MKHDRRGWVVPVVVAMFAMAIGLVLGSGPLRTALIGSLGAQVDSLEEEVAAAELEADRANVTNDYGDDWVAGTAPQLLGSTLAGGNVAFISVDDADADAVSAAQGYVREAGGSVVASVTIESLWTDPNQSAFRAALAPQLAPSISGLDGTESVDELFAQALAQSLLPPVSGGDEGELEVPPDAAAQDHAQVLWTLLTDADLVSGTRDGLANAVVMVAGETPAGEDETSLQATANITLASVVTQFDVAVVAANGPDVDGDLVSDVLADTDGLAQRISTVSWIQTSFSQVTVALALREQFDGWVGHYGPGEDSAAAPPPIGE
ncbi:copper transporter [Demequina oxidasica]|uniref:copper transporter n=1 Tax=Demequina oxidasica TaxID=676199 RepID=UPI000781797D|nr:copper transporter [Demequina oxidasica]